MIAMMGDDCHDFSLPSPLDSRLRGNDGGLGVCIPLAPLRCAKGGGSSLRSEWRIWACGNGI